MNKKNFNRQKTTKPNSEIRTNFYNRLVYIGLCIIPIILFADHKGAIVFVALAFFLIAMYQLIIIIKLSQLIIDDFFPPKISPGKNISRFNKVMSYFATALFFVALIFQIFEIRNFDNTIHGANLFWMAGFAGIGLAVILTILLKLLRPDVYDESDSRFTVHFGLFVGLFLLTPALTGFINRHFAAPTTFCEKYMIASKSTSTGRSPEYYLFIKLDSHHEERFSVSRAQYDSFEEGEEIELCMVKGKLGFDLVKDFKKTED